MKGLYQWLSGRASFFRSDTTNRAVSRTVRTEVTVQREGMALLVGDATAAGFHVCPLCGAELAPKQAEQVSSRLLKGSTSQASQGDAEK
jgi:hypothetical protein